MGTIGPLQSLQHQSRLAGLTRTGNHDQPLRLLVQTAEKRRYLLTFIGMVREITILSNFTQYRNYSFVEQRTRLAGTFIGVGAARTPNWESALEQDYRPEQSIES